MLSLFRRMLHSRVGVIITLGALAIIALAFAAGDITGMRPGGGSVLGGSVAQVGDRKITEAEVTERVREALRMAQRDDPSIDMATFIQRGGFDQVLEQMFNVAALEQFADEAGIVQSRRVIDGEIAGISAFHGPDGKFNQAIYEQVLRQNRVTDAGLRADVGSSILQQWILGPTGEGDYVPAKLAMPYASMVLNRHIGSLGAVPIAAIPPVAVPSDQALQQYLQRNRKRYMIPERRVMRYALVTPAFFSQSATPTDAEIAEAYQKGRSRFAPTEKRTLQQVIVADQNAANALAAKVKAGTPMAAAAPAGYEAQTLNSIEKSTFESQSNAAVAQAVFAAPQGAVVGPLRSPLGWAVVRVEKVEQVAGKSLAEARAELVTELTRNKTAQQMTELHDKLDDATSSSTFDELVADGKLQALKTPPLAAGGVDVTKPGTPPDPAMVPIAQAGFTSERGDDPQLVQTAPDGSFAVVVLDAVLPQAPPPFAEIRERLIQDYRIDEALKSAQAIAQKIVNAANRGTPLPAAIAAAGVKLPAPKPFNLTRNELARVDPKTRDALEQIFSTGPGQARLVSSPDRSGYFILKVDRVERGDATKDPNAVAQTRATFSRVLGNEYAQQLAGAIRRKLGVKRNESEIAKLRAQLLGGGS